MKTSRRDQNIERYQSELSYIRAIQYLEKPQNLISEKVFGRVAKFLERVLYRTDVYPALGGGFNVEWHLSKSFCLTFYDDSINLEVFNESSHHIDQLFEKIQDSSDETEIIETIISLFEFYN